MLDEKMSNEPNATARKLLAKRWPSLSEEKKAVIRSARARRGIRCDICGLIGYYTENCPKNCSFSDSSTTKEATPTCLEVENSSLQTDTSAPSIGILWSSSDKDREQTEEQEQIKPRAYDYMKKIDMNTVRPQAQLELEKLRSTDEKLGTFQFFAMADEGYSRNYSELTLHQLLRRMMRLLDRQLIQNAENLEASFDTTLLQPPFHKDRSSFFPDDLGKVKQFRDYFVEKELKKERRAIHENQAGLRPLDDLDPLFRGGDVSTDFLYKTNPHAGASIHSKNTWKSVLARWDQMASSDPTLAKKQKKLNELFENQSQWISMQQRGMMQKNDRFEHLVYLLKTELKNEHNREGKLLKVTKHSKKATEMEVWQDRLNSVDLLMKCLKSYNFTAGLDEADFLIFCLEKWKKKLNEQMGIANENNSNIEENEETSKIVKTLDKNTSSANSIFSNTNASTDNRTLNSDSKLSKSTKKKKEKTQDSDGYNRMISAASPYFADVAILEDLDKKRKKIQEKARSVAINAIEEEKKFFETIDAYNNEKYGISRLDDGDDDELFTTNSMRNTTNSIRENSPNLQNNSPGFSPKPTGRMVSFPSSTSMVSMISNTSFGETVFTQDSDGKTRNSGITDDWSKSMVSSSALSALTEEQGHTQDSLVLRAQRHSQELEKKREDRKAKRALMKFGSHRTQKKFIKVRIKHPREIDEEKIDKAKGSYRAAGLKSHIRQGVDDDLAYLAPSLIPVPGAFNSDGKNLMISHTANQTLFEIKKDMILGDLGYTPQTMVPLYVRNTLIEKNGTTPGGDQTYETMSTDRRYSHYIGRPLNRFEPDQLIKNSKKRVGSKIPRLQGLLPKL